jgi:hypothetical protein
MRRNLVAAIDAVIADGTVESACGVAVLAGLDPRRLTLIVEGRVDPDEAEREALMELLEVGPDVFDEVG